MAQGRPHARRFLERCSKVYLLKDDCERECAKADTTVYCPTILFGHQPPLTKALGSNDFLKHPRIPLYIG